MGRLRLGLVFAVLGCVPEPGAPVEPRPVEIVAAPGDATVAVEPEVPLLSPVAFREGQIELASWAGRAFAVIDGEPISLEPGRTVARDPSLAAGLLPDKALVTSTHELVAFGGTHVVYAEHLSGSGSTYFCYAREADAWVAKPLPSRGVELRIETHYAAIVETGGALLGLRRHGLRSELWDYGDDDDPDLQAQLRKLGRELGKLERGFVVLAGAIDRVPALPRGMDAIDAISTTSGDVVALGYQHRVDVDGEDGPARILSWPAGASVASVAELPGLVDPSIHDLHIWASGDAVLVGGLRDLPGPVDAPYLAARQPDQSFAELALDLPIAIHERVASAAMDPSGELWIVTGAWNYASEAPCHCVWRKPIDGAWAAVALEPFAFPSDAERGWAHVLSEQTWIEVPAGTPRRLYPAARSVIAAGGAIWLSAELGPSYPTADFVLADPRVVLFSSAAVEAPTQLPSTDQLYDERVDRRAKAQRFTPGSDDCRTFTMVITDDPDGDGHEAAARLLGRLDALRDAATMEREDGWASASMIYVGELDGRAQLVVEAGAWDPKSAEALADAFAQVLGDRPALDCRPRAMVRAIERLR